MINLLEIENTKSLKPLKIDKKQQNFILSLLKEEKDPLKLLKKLKINLKDIKYILNHLPYKEKKEFEKIIEKLIATSKEKTQTDDNLFELINNLSPQQKQKIIENVKKEIELKIKTKKITIPKTTLEEFKKIDNLKELIKFANKKGLNIIKVIITKEIQKTENNFFKTPTIKNKIETKIKSNLPIFNYPNIKKSENKDKSITTLLIQNTNNKQNPKIENQTIKSNLPIFDENKNRISKKEDSLNKTETNLKNISNTKIKSELPIFNENEKLNNKKISYYKNGSIVHDLLKLNTNKEKNLLSIFNYDKKENIAKDEKKLNNEDIKNDFSNIQHSQIQTKIKQNIISAKQSLTHFANNLKEIIENYKPPIQKVSLELHPKKLGKVELTLIHRGENLQININSNQASTINFFNTNQQELKTILTNLGFSDVNMSFNSNQQQNQKHQQQYNKNQKILKQEEEFIIEIPYKYA